jgi:methylated-DNA-[protein]-cysteine S-methyltransferase
MYHMFTWLPPGTGMQMKSKSKKSFGLNRYRARFSTPVGDIEAILSEDGIHAITWLEAEQGAVQPDHTEPNARIKRLDSQLAVQLDEWFAGVRREFELDLQPEGTQFQTRVWRHLESIPYGGKATYSEVAGAIGKPKAVRAVAAAIGANPIPVLIPCHRVIGKDGSLTGYNGGLRRKSWLLALERQSSADYDGLG